MPPSSSRCLYRQRPPSPPDEAHADLSSSARVAIIRAMQKLLEHLTDSVLTGYPSARIAHGLRSAGLRGRANKLLQVLEATVPLQYEGVTLHTTEVQEVLGCTPLLAADTIALMSDFPFLTQVTGSLKGSIMRGLLRRRDGK